MTKSPKTAKTSTGLLVHVVKDHYSGLWNIMYVDGGYWAGPFRTKREAVERMLELAAG